MHIVLIDDDLDDNFFNQRAIRRSGVETRTETFVDSIEGLARILGAADTPDLICVDLHMPRLDGWGLIREYVTACQSEGRMPAPVVIITSTPDPQTRKRAAESTVIVELVAKPLTPDTFRRLVSDHVESGY